MTLDKVEKRIEALLLSDKRWPVIVDFSNRSDMKEFLYHFEVGNNKILSVATSFGVLSLIITRTIFLLLAFPHT